MSVICHRFRKHAVVLFGLLVCTALVYSNSLHNSFHFDDLQITERPNLHLTDLSLKQLRQTFIWTNDDPHLYRPLSCLTLGINFYLGQYNPYGYHLVNIAIHVLTSMAVYWFIYLLLGIPSIRPAWFSKHQYELAVLSAFLFALHPLQTNVATYIIQRMTSLAAIFYIISLCGFILFRRSLLPGTRISATTRTASLLLMLIAAAASLLSKENSAMLPVIIVWTDYLFFYPLCTPAQKKTTLLIYLLLLAGPLLAGLILAPKTVLMLTDPNKIAASFSHRNFTLGQRLLTEPRIVLFYLYQILVPRIDLLNLTHEVQLSTSLLTPPQTLPAIISVLFLLTGAIFIHRKYNLISFSIIWYFANLAIESTILPLELIYEHRTYLPGVLIYMLIAAGLLFIARKFSRQWPAACFLALVLILYGNGTFMRNFVWRTPLTMWEDVVNKSPGLVRSYTNLGIAYMNSGQYRKALPALEQAIRMDHYQPETMTALSKLLILYMDEPERGLAIAEKLYQHDKDTINGCMALGNAYVYLGEFKKAQPYFMEAVRRLPSHSPAWNNLGFCQIKTNDFKGAIQSFHKGLELDPTYKNYAMNLAKVYYNQGNKDAALQVLADFMHNNPQAARVSILYRMIKTSPMQTSFTFEAPKPVDLTASPATVQ